MSTRTDSWQLKICRDPEDRRQTLVDRWTLEGQACCCLSKSPKDAAIHHFTWHFQSEPPALLGKRCEKIAEPTNHDLPVVGRFGQRSGARLHFSETFAIGSAPYDLLFDGIQITR